MSESKTTQVENTTNETLSLFEIKETKNVAQKVKTNTIDIIDLDEKEKEKLLIEKEERECKRLQYKYGITLEQKKDLYTLQKCKCTICEDKLELDDLVVDHCHQTNLVRGLLCNSCNLTLGHAKDSIRILNKAAEYLDNSRRYVVLRGNKKVELKQNIYQ